MRTRLPFAFNAINIFPKLRNRDIPGETMRSPTEKPREWSWWYLLFIVQFAAVLWPPFYNRAEPSWIGMPFFYWYQLLCIILGAVLTAIVYFATARNR
jgi:hypothetical protein